MNEAILLDEPGAVPQDNQDPGALMDPGVYPQDDGTVHVVLDVPLKRGEGAEIYTVKLLRAPTPAETDKAGGRVMVLQMYDSAHKKLLPQLSEPPITERIYDKLSPYDQQNLIMGVSSFFGTSKRRGNVPG